MTAVLIAAGALVLVLIVAFVVLFNRLIGLRNKTDNAWRQIDVELVRRHDMVPRLNDVVVGYVLHERGTLQGATEARSSAIEAQTVGEKSGAEDSLTSAINRVLLLREAYPDLKANTEFMKLQKELSDTETRIAGSRKYYNGAVMHYNNARESFPGNIVAGMLAGSFGPREYFEIKDPADRQAPSVEGT